MRLVTPPHVTVYGTCADQKAQCYRVSCTVCLLFRPRCITWHKGWVAFRSIHQWRFSRARANEKHIDSHDTGTIAIVYCNDLLVIKYVEAQQSSTVGVLDNVVITGKRTGAWHQQPGSAELRPQFECQHVGTAVCGMFKPTHEKVLFFPW